MDIPIFRYCNLIFLLFTLPPVYEIDPFEGTPITCRKALKYPLKCWFVS
jgi:hypothetical protein